MHSALPQILIERSVGSVEQRFCCEIRPLFCISLIATIAGRLFFTNATLRYLCKMFDSADVNPLKKQTVLKNESKCQIRQIITTSSSFAVNISFTGVARARKVEEKDETS